MITRLDHLVLTVGDLAATCEFYEQHLGMEVRSFGAGRIALHFGDQKINLHEISNDHDLVAESPMPGSSDLCFISDRPVAKTKAALEAAGVTIEAGPVERTGARGPIESIYLRDPDRNLIEIANEIER